jgi:predicted transcriptional regulator
VDHKETIAGVPVTEEQIAAWAAEAERGYDAEALRRRGRGRPGRGAGPTQVVPVRLTPDELGLVDSLAGRQGKTRSDVLRDALMAYAA